MAYTPRNAHPAKTPPSHQTVRLGAGRHTVPTQEVCVMELASMLAGEAFSDHPGSVCPVLGALLRAYNDHVDDDTRQALYPLASLVVGTRGARQVEEERTKAMLDWCAQRAAERPWWKRKLRPIPIELPPKSYYLHASTVIRCLPRPMTEGAHREVMALVQQLAGIGGRAEPQRGKPRQRSHPGRRSVVRAGALRVHGQ